MDWRGKWIMVMFLILSCSRALADAETDSHSFGGFAVLSAGHTRVPSNAVNPGNILAIGDYNSEMAFIWDGEFEGTTARVRLAEDASFSPGSGAQSTVTIAELNKIFALGNGYTLSIGKRQLTLDTAFVLQPLGFFQKRIDFTDLNDDRGLAEGLPMVVGTWVGASNSATLVYSDDFFSTPDGFNRGLRQGALNVRHEFTDASLSLTLRKATGESVGAGMAGNVSVNEWLGLYVSSYANQGTNRPILAELANIQSSVQRPDAVGSFRANDGKLYLKASMGFTVNTRSQVSLIVEGDHDGSGMSSAQWNAYRSLIALHQRTLGMPYGSVAERLLESDAQMLRPLGARRDYLYISLSRPFDGLVLQAATYIGMADGSHTLIASATDKLNQYCEASMALNYVHGPSGSEASLSPVASNISVRLRFFF